MLGIPNSTKVTSNAPLSKKRAFSVMEKPNLAEAQKRKYQSRINPINQQPRWYSQSYMLFLALRQHDEETMARTDLIKTALSLDNKISAERKLPKVFRGKTPMNSASAILTNNSDRYFVPFKPDGSRSMHFKLSFEPGNFANAFKEYKEWQEKLITYDWPSCFSKTMEKKKHNIMAIENLVEDLQVVTEEAFYPTEFDEFMAKRKQQRQSWQNRYNTEKCCNLPKSWQDVLYYNVSKQTLEAKRSIPKYTPLGFYFGVPLSEDEFDSMKDGLGKAADYAVMYKKTVIDPTDEHGQLYSHKDVCPFYCVGETSMRHKANVRFYEGHIVNQVICYAKRDIKPNEVLVSYCPNQPPQMPSLFPLTNTHYSSKIETAPSTADNWQNRPAVTANSLLTNKKATISPV